MIRLPPLPVVDAATSTPGVRSIIDGFAYLRRQPLLMMSFAVDLIAMAFGMPRALFPEMAHLDFGGPDNGGLAFALLFAAIPAGAVVGGIVSGWVSRVERQGLAVVVCVAVWGASMIGFGVAVALAMLVLGGAAKHGFGGLPFDDLAVRGRGGVLVVVGVVVTALVVPSFVRYRVTHPDR